MISVIIPALNEKESIIGTISKIKEVLKDTIYEIIVVDDGSNDGTAELSKQAGVKVIRHYYNLGYGRSLKDGIKSAKYDIIAIIDADATYPIERIPDLLKKYQEGVNMVVGARTGENFRESWFKMPLRMILKWIVEFTVGRKIPDINSGLRVFSKKDILPYFNHLCETFSFTTSLTLAYLMTGKFVEHIPVEYHKRIGQSKVRLLRDSLRTLQYIVQTILYYNPIKMFLIICGISTVISFLCFIVFLLFYQKIVFIFFALSLLIIIMIFSVGLLAELIRQRE